MTTSPLDLPAVRADAMASINANALLPDGGLGMSLSLTVLALLDRVEAAEAGWEYDGRGFASALVERNEWRDRAETAEAKVAAVRGLLAELVDPDPCHYDHAGDCQAHGFPVDKETMCPHEEAKQIIARDAE